MDRNEQGGGAQGTPPTDGVAQLMATLVQLMQDRREEQRRRDEEQRRREGPCQRVASPVGGGTRRNRARLPVRSVFATSLLWRGSVAVGPAGAGRTDRRTCR